MYKYILLILSILSFSTSTSISFATPTEKQEIYKLDADSLKEMAQDNSAGELQRIYACKRLARLGQHVDVALRTLMFIAYHCDENQLQEKTISTLAYSPHVTDVQTDLFKGQLQKWVSSGNEAKLRSRAALALLDLDISVEKKKELEQILQELIDTTPDIRAKLRALNYLQKESNFKPGREFYRDLLVEILEFVTPAIKQKSIEHQKAIVECLNIMAVHKIICEEPIQLRYWIKTLNEIIAATTHETVKAKAEAALIEFKAGNPDGNWVHFVREIQGFIKAKTKLNNKLLLLKKQYAFGSSYFDEVNFFTTFFDVVSHAEFDGRYDADTMAILDELHRVYSLTSSSTGQELNDQIGLKKIEALDAQIAEKAKPVAAKLKAHLFSLGHYLVVPEKNIESVLDMGQNAASFAIRLQALDALLECVAVRRDYSDKLLAAYMEIARQKKYPEIASRAISTLRNSLYIYQHINQHHVKTLDGLHLDIIKGDGHEEIRFQAIQMLWSHTVAKEAHRDVLIDKFFDIFPKLIKDETIYHLFAIRDDFTKNQREMSATQMDRFLECIIGALIDANYRIRKRTDNMLTQIAASKDAGKIYGLLKLVTQIAHKMKEKIPLDTLSLNQKGYCQEFVQFWQIKDVPEIYEQSLKFSDQLAEISLDMVENMKSGSVDIRLVHPLVVGELWRLYEHENIRKKHLGRIIKIHLQYQKASSEKQKLSVFEHLATDEFNEDLAELFEHAVRYSAQANIIDQVRELMKKESFPSCYHPYLISGLVKKLKNTEFPTDNNLEAYIAFGNPFQAAFNDYMNGGWRLCLEAIQRDILIRLAEKYGGRHPVLQGLWWLVNNPSVNSPEIYELLLDKLKEPYTHRPAKSSLKLALDEDRTLQVNFEIDPAVFTYVPATQKALADLSDVDLVLGNYFDVEMAKLSAKKDEVAESTNELAKEIAQLQALKDLRCNLDFTKYFAAPYNEEALMLQALVKKYKFMGEGGKTRLVKLMKEMQHCKTGKNLAVSENYKVESKPLVEAVLKHVMTWVRRLENEDNPLLTEAESLENFKKSRKDAATLIYNIMKPGHHFRQHLTDLPHDDAAKLMRGLLGRLVEGEAGAGLVDLKEREALKKSLIQAVGILLELQDPKTFFTNLSRLCRDYEVALPANKYEQNLSGDAIEGLILKLKASDAEGLGELVALQTEMREFMKKPDVKALLDNLTDEEGVLFRELMDGYVSNGWAAGFMKLVIAARDMPLKQAVVMTHKNTRIDKDLPLNWDTLKKVVLREISTIKRDCLHSLVLGCTHEENALEHTLEYAEGLLGGAIGMRPADKMPDFDLYAHHVVRTFKDMSLQGLLSTFETQFTPQKIIDHLKFMIKNNQLNVISPMSGENMIWVLLGQVAKEYLRAKKIEEYDATQIVLGEGKNNANDLAIALMLKKLGLLREVE